MFTRKKYCVQTIVRHKWEIHNAMWQHEGQLCVKFDRVIEKIRLNWKNR